MRLAQRITLLQVDKTTHWGDLESEEEESSDEEEEEADEQVEVDTASLADGLSSVVSGYSSLPSGLETPEALDLRKGKAAGQQTPSPPLEPTSAACSCQMIPVCTPPHDNTFNLLVLPLPCKFPERHSRSAPSLTREPSAAILLQRISRWTRCWSSRS